MVGLTYRSVCVRVGGGRDGGVCLCLCGDGGVCGGGGGGILDQDVIHYDTRLRKHS